MAIYRIATVRMLHCPQLSISLITGFNYCIGNVFAPLSLYDDHNQMHMHLHSTYVSC